MVESSLGFTWVLLAISAVLLLAVNGDEGDAISEATEAATSGKKADEDTDGGKTVVWEPWTFMNQLKAVREKLKSTCILDSKVIPAVGSASLEVGFSLMPKTFLEINQEEQTFTMMAMIDLVWDYNCKAMAPDNRAAYWQVNFSETNQDLLDSISLPIQDIWHPIINHINAVDQIQQIEDFSGGSEGLLDIIGRFRWNIIVRLSSVCRLKLQKFPFDRQTCSVEFENAQDQVSLVPDVTDYTEEYQTSFINPAFAWQVDGRYNASRKVHQYSQAGREYTRITFNFHFKRKPGVYVTFVIAPWFLLTILQLAGLLMPPEPADRTLYSVTILLAVGVVQTQINGMIPVSAELPHIMTLLTAQLAISVMATIYSITAGELAGRPPYQRKVAFIAGSCRLIRVIDCLAFCGLALITVATSCYVFYQMLI